MSWVCSVCGSGNEADHTNCGLISAINDLTDAARELTQAVRDLHEGMKR